MKKLCSSFLLLALAYLSASEATAQHFNRRKLYNTVSVHLNAMNYFGDLVPKTSFASLRFGATRPNLGFSYMHRFAPRISGRVAFNYGRITGDDQKAADANDNDASYRYYRNLSFRNDIIELSGVGIVDLFENRGTYLKRREFAPYLFGGIAVFRHNPKGQLPDGGAYVALQPLGTEGQYAANRDAKKYPTPYSRFQISMPFGAGIRYKLDRQYDLGFEIGWRKTFTDYLDDVSGKYANPVDLSDQARKMADKSGELTKTLSARDKVKYSGYGVAGSKRGTDNEDDWYIVSGFNFSYILTPKLKSPKFR